MRFPIPTREVCAGHAANRSDALVFTNVGTHCGTDAAHQCKRRAWDACDCFEQIMHALPGHHSTDLENSQAGPASGLQERKSGGTRKKPQIDAEWIDEQLSRRHAGADECICDERTRYSDVIGRL